MTDLDKARSFALAPTRYMHPLSISALCSRSDRGRQLHFSEPAAYHELYNNSNRWNKEAELYQSFGEDRSSFGFLTYAESKQRKDIMAPLFSRRAIFELQGLVQTNVPTTPHYSILWLHI